MPMTEQEVSNALDGIANVNNQADINNIKFFLLTWFTALVNARSWEHAVLCYGL